MVIGVNPITSRFGVCTMSESINPTRQQTSQIIHREVLQTGLKRIGVMNRAGTGVGSWGVAFEGSAWAPTEPCSPCERQSFRGAGARPLVAWRASSCAASTRLPHPWSSETTAVSAEIQFPDHRGALLSRPRVQKADRSGRATAD